MTANEQAVADVLNQYQDALNQSSTDAAVALYAPDGVFMPQHSPSSVGTEALRKAYDAVFAAITLAVKFEIAEVRELSPDWFLARTNSTGISSFHASGVTGAEANQELFLFQKIDASWKIARYCFCTTNPPQA